MKKVNNKIIVIGGKGQLGTELVQIGENKGLNIKSLDLPEFDLTDSENVKLYINQKEASLVINTAAYTAVDKAQSEEKIAFAVNSDGPYNLAVACKEASIPMIHISTDYVFNGNKKEPYLPSDKVSPESVYGKSKAEGDERVRKTLLKHIIIRTSWLFGNYGNNFVKTMLRIGNEKETISVVGDQYGCPTNAFDLAEAVLVVAACINQKKSENIKWNTYHFCNRGGTNWFDFAGEIFRQAGQYTDFKLKNLKKITTKEYPTPAKRPIMSILDCQSIINNFGVIQRPWQESLSDMLAQHFVV